MSVRPGKWLASDGGGLTISEVSGRTLSGSFRSTEGRVSPDESFDVIGFTNGKVVGFTVLWERDGGPNANSLAVWAGRYFEAGEGQKGALGDHTRERIECNWHLHRLFQEDGSTPNNMWEGSHVGYAVFYWKD